MVTGSSEGLCGGSRRIKRVGDYHRSGLVVSYVLGYVMSISGFQATRRWPEDTEYWIRYGLDG